MVRKMVIINRNNEAPKKTVLKPPIANRPPAAIGPTACPKRLVTPFADITPALNSFGASAISRPWNAGNPIPRAKPINITGMIINQVDVTNGKNRIVIASIIIDVINSHSSLAILISFPIKNAINDPAITRVEIIMPITTADAPNFVPI